MSCYSVAVWFVYMSCSILMICADVLFFIQNCYACCLCTNEPYFVILPNVFYIYFVQYHFIVEFLQFDQLLCAAWVSLAKDISFLCLKNGLRYIFLKHCYIYMFCMALKSPLCTILLHKLIVLLLIWNCLNYYIGSCFYLI